MANAPERIPAEKANDVFRRGGMLNPVSWVLGDPGSDGRVDFDNDENATELTVSAFPSTVEDGVIVVQIDPIIARRLKIVVNDETVWVGDTQ